MGKVKDLEWDSPKRVGLQTARKSTSGVRKKVKKVPEPRRDQEGEEDDVSSVVFIEERKKDQIQIILIELDTPEEEVENSPSENVKPEEMEKEEEEDDDRRYEIRIVDINSLLEPESPSPPASPLQVIGKDPHHIGSPPKMKNNKDEMSWSPPSMVPPPVIPDAFRSSLPAGGDTFARSVARVTGAPLGTVTSRWQPPLPPEQPPAPPPPPPPPIIMRTPVVRPWIPPPLPVPPPVPNLSMHMPPSPWMEWPGTTVLGCGAAVPTAGLTGMAQVSIGPRVIPDNINRIIYVVNLSLSRDERCVYLLFFPCGRIQHIHGGAAGSYSAHALVTFAHPHMADVALAQGQFMSHCNRRVFVSRYQPPIVSRDGKGIVQLPPVGRMAGFVTVPATPPQVQFTPKPVPPPPKSVPPPPKPVLPSPNQVPPPPKPVLPPPKPVPPPPKPVLPPPKPAPPPPKLVLPPPKPVPPPPVTFEERKSSGETPVITCFLDCGEIVPAVKLAKFSEKITCRVYSAFRIEKLIYIQNLSSSCNAKCVFALFDSCSCGTIRNIQCGPAGTKDGFSSSHAVVAFSKPSMAQKALSHGKYLKHGDRLLSVSRYQPPERIPGMDCAIPRLPRIKADSVESGPPRIQMQSEKRVQPGMTDDDDGGVEVLLFKRGFVDISE